MNKPRRVVGKRVASLLSDLGVVRVDDYAGLSVFTDGGCEAHNPSSVGGTSAFIVVDNGKLIHASATFWPAVQNCNYEAALGYHHFAGEITNNQMELMAMIQAVRWLEFHQNYQHGEYNGRTELLIGSDSNVTLQRAFEYARLENVPETMVRELAVAKNRIEQIAYRAKVRYVLLQGHPTKADLENGIGKKRLLPVSKWNVACDRMCNMVYAAWLAAEDRKKNKIYPTEFDMTRDMGFKYFK